MEMARKNISNDFEKLVLETILIEYFRHYAFIISPSAVKLSCYFFCGCFEYNC